MKLPRKFRLFFAFLIFPLTLTEIVSADSLEILKDEPAPQKALDTSEAHIRYLQQLAPSAAGEESQTEDSVKDRELNQSVKAFDKTNNGLEPTGRPLQPYDFIE